MTQYWKDIKATRGEKIKAKSMSELNRFQAGKSYGVWLWDDSDPVVTVASRTDKTVTLTDGTTHKIVHGLAPTPVGQTDAGQRAEIIRIPAEIGEGVVRVCHEIKREQGDLFNAA